MGSAQSYPGSVPLLRQRDPRRAPGGRHHADAFHVVALGVQVVDEVRLRVQRKTLGHRGGPVIRSIESGGSKQIGVEHLTEKRIRRLNAKLEDGDLHREVPHLPDPGDRPTRPGLAAVKGHDTRLLRHRRRFEWTYRSWQGPHRNHAEE